MAVVYIFVVFLVTCFLLCLPLFPFWKVWKRIKDHHPDLWDSKGPFTPRAMLADTYLMRSFFDIITLADRDEVLVARDPELIKWTRVAREVWKVMPRSFGAQIFTFILFLYFVGFFTSLIMDIFR